MAETLKDPNKPAGYVFPEDVNEDGSATCNDGRKLKSARKNPWYVLATIYGEYDVRTSPHVRYETIFKNRRAWNGWACARMADARRAELAEKMGLDPSELQPFSGKEKADIQRRFCKRMEDETAKLPSPKDRIDFTKTYFKEPLKISKYVFSSDADFHSAAFSSDADFYSATFSGHASFASAAFSGPASFASATFSGRADFFKSKFSSFAEISSATFFGNADFLCATFSGPASLAFASFFGSASLFASATFCGLASFESAKFRGITRFDDAIFETHVPCFQGA